MKLGVFYEGAFKVKQILSSNLFITARADFNDNMQQNLLSYICIQIGDKTMADKSIYIANDDAQNYLFCRLKLVVETFGHLT